MVEKWLHKIEDKFPGSKIDCYTVMPDHIHFILFLNFYEEKINNRATTRGRPYELSEVVGWFKTMTTNDYIKGVKEGRFSPFEKRFWQRNYYEHIIRGEEDLEEIRNYIFGNPLK